MTTRLKRAYDPAEPGDGYRVLVDRLWPRGVRKEELELDEWLRDVAPSTELRRWFGHDDSRWDEFRRRYEAELQHEPAATRIAQLREREREGQQLTLVFAARDAEHSNAEVLREVIEADAPA